MRGARALSWIEALLIVSILTFVFAASHPRLRGETIARNEARALATLGRLWEERREFERASPGRRDPLSILLRASGQGGPGIEGGTLLEDEILRAHGYLFRLCPSSSPPGESRPTDAAPPLDLGSPFAALAWPFEYGATGNAAFFLDGTGVCRESRNARRRYSGLDRPPSLRAAERDPEAAGANPERYFGMDREEWRVVPLPGG